MVWEDRVKCISIQNGIRCFYITGASALLQRAAATSRHLRWARGAEPVTHPEQPGDGGGARGDATDGEKHENKNVSSD